MGTGAEPIDRALPQEVVPLATAFAKAGIGDESFRIMYRASGAGGVDALVKYLAERRIIEPNRGSAPRGAPRLRDGARVVDAWRY